jgi:sortase A
MLSRLLGWSWFGAPARALFAGWSCRPAQNTPILHLKLYMKRKLRRGVLSPLLFALGAVLLFYVASAYYSMYREQKDLEQLWKIQAAAAEHTGNGAVAASHNANALTRVVIPRISLDAVMVEGVTKKQLAKGPGHMTETAVPGEPGNAVITGHRDTFFRHIYELQNGDDILIRRSGQIYRFQVTGKKIVMPQDVYVLHQTPDAELTLITCYPTYYIGPAPKRLVVFSKLADTKADVEGQSETAAGSSH